MAARSARADGLRSSRTAGKGEPNGERIHDDSQDHSDERISDGIDDWSGGRIHADALDPDDERASGNHVHYDELTGDIHGHAGEHFLARRVSPRLSSAPVAAIAAARMVGMLA